MFFVLSVSLKMPLSTLSSAITQSPLFVIPLVHFDRAPANNRLFDCRMQGKWCAPSSVGWN